MNLPSDPVSLIERRSPLVLVLGQLHLGYELVGLTARIRTSRRFRPASNPATSNRGSPKAVPFANPKMTPLISTPSTLAAVIAQAAPMGASLPPAMTATKAKATVEFAGPSAEPSPPRPPRQPRMTGSSHSGTGLRRAVRQSSRPHAAKRRPIPTSTASSNARCWALPESVRVRRQTSTKAAARASQNPARSVSHDLKAGVPSQSGAWTDLVSRRWPRIPEGPAR